MERTIKRCEDCEVQIQELEDELKVVGQNMKTLELSETDALARQEKFEETIRTLTHSLKVSSIALICDCKRVGNGAHSVDELLKGCCPPLLPESHPSTSSCKPALIDGVKELEELPILLIHI